MLSVMAGLTGGIISYCLLAEGSQAAVFNLCPQRAKHQVLHDG